MAGTVDGSITIKTDVDTKGFKSGRKQIENGISGIKSSLGKLASTVGVAFSVAALVNFGKSAVEIASNIAEVQNVVDTAFGSMKQKCEDFASTAIEQFGLSELTAKRTASTYMAMARSIGFTDDAASDMAISLAGLTGDVASFYNVDQSVADTALKSVFTGETESLKQFGVMMTQTNLDAFALQQGLSKTYSKMSQAEQTSLRYAYVTQQLSLAQGDFAKTSDSWANQTRILTQRWDEFKGIAGSLLINVLTPLLSMLNNIVAALVNAAKSMESFFGIKSEDDQSATMQNVTSSTNEAADAQDNLASSTEKAAKAAKDNLQAFDKLNVRQKDTSSDSDTSGDTSSVGLGNDSGGNSADKPNKYIKLADDVKKIFASLKKWIDDNFSLDFSQIGKNFKSAFGSLKEIAAKTFPGIQTMASSALGAAGSLFTGMAQIFAKRINTLSEGVRKFFNNNKQKIIDGINTISGNLTKGFDGLKKFYESIFGTIGDSIDRMRGTVSDAISNLLGGYTQLALSIGEIAFDAFAIWTENLANWADENSGKIGETFDSFQQLGADLMNLFGDIFGDIGKSLSDWWNGEMKPVWDKICKAVLGVADTVMNVWNKWIYPVIQKVIAWSHEMWDKNLKPVFDAALSFIAKVGDCIATVWNNFLKPVVDWIIKSAAPTIMNVVDTVLGVIGTIIGVISGVVQGILKSLGGLLDFITGIFSGNWKKAWNGIKNFFGGIWDGIWSIVKGTVNLIIDGINMLWTGIYNAVSGIVNGIGGIAGAIGSIFGQDWSFKMPEKAPRIPKLATGAVIPPNSEFLAILGDQKSGNNIEAPESLIRRIVREESGKTDSSAVVAAINNLTQVLINKKLIDSPEKFARDYKPYFDAESKRSGTNAVAGFVN